MLAAVAEAADDMTAARAVLAIQHDLLNATASRLVGPASEAGDAALARTAVARARPVVEQRGDIAVVAVALGIIDGHPRAALHELGRVTPITLALAEERLILTSALLASRCGDSWPGVVTVATQLAEAPPGGFGDAPATAAALCGAARIVIARVDDGVVRAVGDSSGGNSAEHLAQLRLACGEAYDLGANDGISLPPGLAALSAGRPLTARHATIGSRSAVIVAVEAQYPDRLMAIVTLVAAIRPRRRSIIPAALVATGAAQLPWPAHWAASRRATATRRLIMALPVALLLVPVPTTVDAAATIEPLNQRIVTAPFDGRIATVAVQPGDAVRADRTVLLRLDARAAESERADVVASLQAALAQAGEAQVDGRSDDERIARLHAAQFAARADLLALQIASATIVAPIDGIVAGDDLRRRTGGPVSRGETLMTVAAPGNYRAEVRVPDRDIGPVQVGDRMAMALKAQPLARPHGTVTRIYPVAEIEDGDNIFRVIARLDPKTPDLLPGMEGKASIHTGWTVLGWWVLRSPVRWLRLKLWI